MLNANQEYINGRMKVCKKNDGIPQELYDKYHVFRGLRDLNGNGVLTGLTNISKIKAFDVAADGRKVPAEGELWYRGYKVEELFQWLDRRLGFEAIAYLLLMGDLPSKVEEKEFSQFLVEMRKLPKNFAKDVIMKASTEDIMNNMTRSVLTLASYDRSIKNMSLEVSLRQCIQLISEFPLIAIYGYHAYNHYVKGNDMFIHRPDPALSTAENILMMLRSDKTYTDVEAKVLDTALILHMEHGGGNNSTFTTRVVTSSGSDTYSTMAAAMSSLKGSKHGGANIKVVEMMKDIAKNVNDYSDREEVTAYLTRMLDKEVFDKQGLIYGMGHAVYSISDPREVIFKAYVKELALQKGKEKQLQLYENVEQEAIRLICEKRHIYKGVCPNIDFYSGFVYNMLGIPKELFTPMFAIARIVGWSAHRMEELIGVNKIIRPAYMSIMQEREL